MDVYIEARDKGPITDCPQTRFKFISRPEVGRSRPNKMRREGEGAPYLPSRPCSPCYCGQFPGNTQKGHNICPVLSCHVDTDLETLRLLLYRYSFVQFYRSICTWLCTLFIFLLK